MQDGYIASGLAMGILQSSTEPSKRYVPSDSCVCLPLFFMVASLSPQHSFLAWKQGSNMDMDKITITPTKSKHSKMWMEYIDGLGRDCSNSSALAMELLQSCTEPLKWFLGCSLFRRYSSYSLKLSMANTLILNWQQWNGINRINQWLTINLIWGPH